MLGFSTLIIGKYHNCEKAALKWHRVQWCEVNLGFPPFSRVFPAWATVFVHESFHLLKCQHLWKQVVPFWGWTLNLNWRWDMKWWVTEGCHVAQNIPIFWWLDGTWPVPSMGFCLSPWVLEARNAQTTQSITVLDTNVLKRRKEHYWHNVFFSLFALATWRLTCLVLSFDRDWNLKLHFSLNALVEEGVMTPKFTAPMDELHELGRLKDSENWLLVYIHLYCVCIHIYVYRQMILIGPQDKFGGSILGTHPHSILEHRTQVSRHRCPPPPHWIGAWVWSVSLSKYRSL